MPKINATVASPNTEQSNPILFVDIHVRKVLCEPHTKTQSRIDKRITAFALDFDFAYRNNNNPKNASKNIQNNLT